MQLKHLQELTTIVEATSGGFFTEANGYSDSGEFTNEFYDLFAQVTKMKKVMKNQKWLDYMKMTDFSMSTSTESLARDAIKAIVALENSLQAIDKEFDKANGHDDGDDELPNDGLDDVTEEADEEPKQPRGASTRGR
jgi:hypothetical protein